MEMLNLDGFLNLQPSTDKEWKMSKIDKLVGPNKCVDGEIISLDK